MKMADCHPERPHKAKGLCAQCYLRKWHEENKEHYYEYRRRPEVLERERLQAQERYRNNSEQMRENSHKYRYKHKNDPERIEKIRQANQRYYKENMTEERRRRQYLRYHYGITLEEYATLLDEQGERCAICGMTPEDNGRRLCVDHDHKTGVVRGLLCLCCNTVLGNARDNPKILRTGALYLERFIDE